MTKLETGPDVLAAMMAEEAAILEMYEAALEG